MKRLIQTILVMFVVTNMYAQHNFLDPCIEIERIQKIKTYNAELDSKINAELSNNYLIRFIVKPAFSPEYAFQIEKDSLHYVIKTLKFRNNLWNSKSWEAVKVDYNQTNLDSMVALNIDRLFNKITSSAIKRKTASGMGEDGVTYNFYKMTSKGVINCGECWSPAKGTSLYKLVSICNSLSELKSNENTDFQDMIKRIELLYDKLK